MENNRLSSNKLKSTLKENGFDVFNPVLSELNVRRNGEFVCDLSMYSNQSNYFVILDVLLSEIDYMIEVSPNVGLEELRKIVNTLVRKNKISDLLVEI